MYGVGGVDAGQELSNSCAFAHTRSSGSALRRHGGGHRGGLQRAHRRPAVRVRGAGQLVQPGAGLADLLRVHDRGALPRPRAARWPRPRAVFVFRRAVLPRQQGANAHGPQALTNSTGSLHRNARALRQPNVALVRASTGALLPACCAPSGCARCSRGVEQAGGRARPLPSCALKQQGACAGGSGSPVCSPERWQE